MLEPPVSSDHLATMVSAQPRPLVFLDTAAILDVSRVPYRQELQVEIIESTAAMIDDLVAHPRRLWVVTTENVIQEFQSHRGSVQQELETRISHLNQSIARLSRVARIVFPERRVSPLEWPDMTLQNRVVEIMDRFVASMVVFRGTKDCISKARDRLGQRVHGAPRSDVLAVAVNFSVPPPPLATVILSVAGLPPWRKENLTALGRTARAGRDAAATVNFSAMLNTGGVALEEVTSIVAAYSRGPNPARLALICNLVGIVPSCGITVGQDPAGRPSRDPAPCSRDSKFHGPAAPS